MRLIASDRLTDLHTYRRTEWFMELYFAAKNSLTRTTQDIDSNSLFLRQI